MQIKPELTYVVIAALIFYLRVMQLRGRRKREAREAELERIRTHRKQPQEDSFTKPTIQVRNWWLVGVGVLFSLVGLLLNYPPAWVPAELAPYWWVIASLGFIVLAFSVK